MALSLAGRQGFRRSLTFCLGVFFGFLIVMSACAAFSGLLYSLIPSLEPWLRRIGGLYILVLAWLLYRDQGTGPAEENSRQGGLATGLLMQLVNVKVIIYGLTALSVFILPHCRSGVGLAGFVLILSLTGLAGTLTWAWFGSLLKNIFTRHRRLANSLLALTLVLCAGSILLG
jgi:threonine/homoserine/homoserine lactone efflux protein